MISKNTWIAFHLFVKYNGVMLHDIYALSQRFMTIKNAQYRRYFIRNQPINTRLALLLGQRGVGKTTTLIQSLLDRVDGDFLDPRILYIQADHFSMGQTALYEIAEQFRNLGGIWLAIDEIHKYTDWSKELKSIYDTFPEIQVFASGSSLMEIQKGTHDLARRAVTYHMEGMSFREYLDIRLGACFNAFTLEEILSDHIKIAHELVRELERNQIRPLAAFHDYLKAGYYPYYFELKEENAYWMTIEQNFHATLDSDLSAIYPNLTHVSLIKIKKLLTFIAGCVPFMPNWERLKKELEIGDIRTLKTYCKYLEDAGLIRTIHSASTKLALDKPAKIFLNNPNQAYALALSKPNMGNLRETFFFSMLSVNHSVAIPNPGDALVDQTWLFEVGGQGKDFTQIKNQKNGYLACDDLEIGQGDKIPLWLFGFLY